MKVSWFRPSARGNRNRALSLVPALLLAASIALPSGAAPVTAAQGQPEAQQPNVGPVSALALDNLGGGWGWTGPRNQQDSGHLIRLQNGQWQDVPRNSAEAGALGTAAAVYGISLTPDGQSGWAIGAGGGQRIWQLRSGRWALANNPFDPESTLINMSVSSDGTDGWITAQDKSVRFVVARLRNGAWQRDYQPTFAELRYITISPDAKSGWGVGEFRNDPKKTVVVRLDNGRWVDDPAKMFEVPANSGPPAADNLGNGWIAAPPIASALIRLTPTGAKQILPDPNSERPEFAPGIVVQYIAVNGFGRGWATASIKRENPLAGAAPTFEPILFRLDGDRVTRIATDIIPIAPAGNADQMPNYGGPIAFSPDGAHSWMAVSSSESRFLKLAELREPWQHETPAAAAPLQGPGLCFAEVQYCLRGEFARYWIERGGLESMGFPITPEIRENLSGTEFVVQYTQRARIEWHPENPAPHKVLLGLLGNTIVDTRLNEDPFRPAQQINQPGYFYFAVTRHNINQPISTYWNANGGVPIFGYPRSEPFTEKSQTDQKSYLVQYFERNRIEHHPENAGTRFEFLLGLLGVEQFEKTFGFKP